MGKVVDKSATEVSGVARGRGGGGGGGVNVSALLMLMGKVKFFAHLNLLRLSFWDTAMSVVRVDVHRPSINFLACVHSRGNSFDPKFMKLGQNVNHHNI